jgi:hypothetical protein
MDVHLGEVLEAYVRQQAESGAYDQFLKRKKRNG